MDDLHLREAYGKYLTVFPSYWDTQTYKPYPFEDFKFFYKLAIHHKEKYLNDMTKGTLHPVSLYMKTQFDEFLGIPHTRQELTSAFQMMKTG